MTCMRKDRDSRSANIENDSRLARKCRRNYRLRRRYVRSGEKCETRMKSLQMSLLANFLSVFLDRQSGMVRAGWDSLIALSSGRSLASRLSDSAIAQAERTMQAVPDSVSSSETRVADQASAESCWNARRPLRRRRRSTASTQCAF